MQRADIQRKIDKIEDRINFLDTGIRALTLE